MSVMVQEAPPCTRSPSQVPHDDGNDRKSTACIGPEATAAAAVLAPYVFMNLDAVFALP